MMRCLAVLLFIATIASTAAADTDAQAVLERMRDAYAGLHSVHLVANQVEEISLGQFGSTTNEDCELVIKPGGKYRVRIKSGDDESIAVSDGTKTFKAQPRSRQWSQIDAASAISASDEEDEGVSPPKDLRTVTQEMFLSRYLAVAHKGKDPQIIKEENYKLGKEKVPCDVVRVQINNNLHDLWIDKNRGFVMQEVQTSHMKTNQGDALVKSTIKLKELETEGAVEDVFEFAPQRGWREVEMLLLPGEQRTVLTGMAAADFKIKAIDGDTVQLSDLRGKVVVLDFWATWCPPCRAELPWIDKMRAEFGDKVQFLGIDDEENSVIKAFLHKNQYELTVLADAKDAVHRQYGVSAIPTVVVIGKDGIIKSHFIGTRSPEMLRSAILAAER